MVTPDIHGCVRLDLVTGSPEKADDEDIQFLGKMLLDSLEPKSLQFSLLDHTLVTLLKVIRRAEVVQVRGVEGLELAFHRCVAMVPREVVSSDRPRGGSPPQRNTSLSSAMTLRGRVCEIMVGVVLQNSDRFPTCLA